VVAPPSCTFFSDDGVDVDGKALSRFSLVGACSRFAIYFPNGNRFRTKTIDLFKAVLEDDYDVIALLETSLVIVHSLTRNCSMQGILFSDAIAAFQPAPKSLDCGETDFRCQ
jgi:hypothetical protein